MRSPIKYSWRRRTTRRSIRRTIRRSGVFSPLRSAAIGEGEAMLNCPKTGLFAAAFLAAVALSPASPAGERKGRPWTFEDILLVPEVNELALSAEGRFAIYSAEIADTGAKRTPAQIRIVDIRARTQRRNAPPDIAKSLTRIPTSGHRRGPPQYGAGLPPYRHPP